MLNSLKNERETILIFIGNKTACFSSPHKNENENIKLGEEGLVFVLLLVYCFIEIYALS